MANQILSATVRDRIELGRIGLAIKNDRTLRSTPNGRIRAASAVKLLATALGMHFETFKESLKLVETFTADELEMFCTRKSDAGVPISIVHLHWIALIRSADQRNQFIDFFYTNSPTYQELGAMCIDYQQSLSAAKTSDETESDLDEQTDAME
jgi:hypothetical protein